MANNVEWDEGTPHRNEWEVVMLTQSVYAAAPGPKLVGLVDENSADYVAETSDPMFMSGHFVVPPNQHEDSALQPDNDEIPSEQGRKDASPELVSDKGVNSDIDEERTKTKVFSTTKFSGNQIFDEKGSILSACGAEFEEDAILQGFGLVDKERNFFDATAYSSFHSEELMCGSASTEESNIVAEPVEPVHQGIDSAISNCPKAKDEDNYDAENLPCLTWWKRRAVSFIAHAKDANAFWSIFVAAAVMGLVVIGQR